MSMEQDTMLELPSYLCGEPAEGEKVLEVNYLWDGSLVGSLAKITAPQAEQCLLQTLEAHRNANH